MVSIKKILIQVEFNHLDVTDCTNRERCSKPLSPKEDGFPLIQN